MFNAHLIETQQEQKLLVHQTFDSSELPKLFQWSKVVPVIVPAYTGCSTCHSSMFIDISMQSDFR